MTKWKTIALGELYDFSSGLSKGRKFFGYGYGFVSFRDVFYNYFLPDELTELVDSTDKERKACSVRRGDVFLTRTSETMNELGMSSVALRDYKNATFNGFTKRLRPKQENVVVPEFAGYYFRSPKFRKTVSQYAIMTTRASLNNEILKRLTIDLPPYETQKEIAEILKSLDDKIQLNTRINKNLEAFANALFKQWFVDFEFPNENGQPYKSSGGLLVDTELGKIPENWKVATFDEIVTVKGGTTPSTKEAKFWGGEYHWTSPKDLSNLEFPILLDTEKKVTLDGLKRISSGLLPKGTLLLSSRAPIGYLAITQIETAINQGYIAINSKSGFSNLFVLYWIRHNMNLIIERANGSTFLEISKSNFKEIKLVVPSTEVHDQFFKLIAPLFEHLILNQIESCNLNMLRDRILPKLMSGKIAIH